MVSAEAIGHAAQNFLLFSNLLQTLKIDNLLVPETVPMTSQDVLLDCQYTAADDRFVLQWFVNGSDTPVYHWRPWQEPHVSGVLVGRLDLNYRASTRIMESRRALRIVHLDPDISGEYTCKITADDGAETRRSASMLIFSPEREFALTLCRNESARVLEVKCIARGLHPHPELTIEHDSQPIPKQIQRVWRNPESLFDAETSLCLTEVHARWLQRITCRLQLPQAGYVVMKEEQLYADPKLQNNALTASPRMLFILIYSFIFHTVN